MTPTSQRQYMMQIDDLRQQLAECQRERDEALIELDAMNANLQGYIAKSVKLTKQRDELAVAAQMAIGMIETNAYERRHVRWKLKDALATLGAGKANDALHPSHDSEYSANVALKSGAGNTGEVQT